jgi:hypothetical protein
LISSFNSPSPESLRRQPRKDSHTNQVAEEYVCLALYPIKMDIFS